MWQQKIRKGIEYINKLLPNYKKRRESYIRSQEILKYEKKLTILITQEVARKIMLAKQNYFENANKTGKLITNKLRQKKEKKRLRN